MTWIPLSGTALPGGTPLIVKTCRVSFTLDASGDGTVTFPGAFPNGLAAVSVKPGTVSANGIKFVPWGATPSTINLRGYSGAEVLNNSDVTCDVYAIGW